MSIFEQKCQLLCGLGNSERDDWVYSSKILRVSRQRSGVFSPVRSFSKVNSSPQR